MTAQAMPPPTIDVRLLPLPPLPELGSSWLALESRARPAFFLTWSWIGSWLQWLSAHPVAPQLLCARLGERVVGLAIVCQGRGTSRLRRRAPALYINQSGVPALDRITIEYNGFLLDPDHAEAASQAMWRCLGATPAGGQETRLSLYDLARQPAVTAPAGMTPAMTMRTAWVVDLRQVRARGGDYIATLSSSRRATIRRSLRSYAELGPLGVSEARDLAMARDYLARLKVLHTRRWGDGNFASAEVAPFHDALVTDAMARGRLQILRVHAGEHDIGYLLSFVVDGHVFFYQSGFDYELQGGREAPGLATLAMAIEHNARAGHDVFDFLAGDMPYKAALGERREALCTLVLRRDSLAHALEERLRQLARRLRETAETLQPRLAGHAVAFIAALLMPMTPELPEVHDLIHHRTASAQAWRDDDEDEPSDDAAPPPAAG